MVAAQEDMITLDMPEELREYGLVEKLNQFLGVGLSGFHRSVDNRG